MMLRFSVITYTFGRLTTKKHNKVMKKLIFLFAFCRTVTNIFAQTDPSQLKKEGSDAFNAKNYPVAYAKFSEYCLLYTSPSPRDRTRSRMPSSA